ncbi:hypothetical protein [Parasitella parasitica]|uniref:dolichol kinase n=1 Tax=Parasitella parasitica TaxID=35722 RepID=A0A0B7N7N1_9FUNG|nr:hypothetical protein [Parasitella parasitica]
MWTTITLSQIADNPVVYPTHSFTLSNSSHHAEFNQKSSSRLVSSHQQHQPQGGRGGGDADADEGFASSSSVEEDQIFEVIRRKRSSHQMPAKTNGPDPIEKSRKLLHEKIKMAPLESILWIMSFFWVFYQVFKTRAFDNQVIAGWIGSILLGILMVRFSSKQKSRNEDSATSSDEQLDVHDHHLKKSDGDLLNKKTSGKTSSEFPESINRIFGASKTSFRANADDGLLCGVLLLPMVAATKLIDASNKNADRFQIAYLQVRMELVLFMSVILLLLVLINDYSHPVKRVIRKRGLFVSSICVSALCTTLLTQLTPLAPMLAETPIAMTVLSVTMFQWFLYICVVTLKKCFTLGEMCVISQAAAVVVYGASEYICLAARMIFIGVFTYPLLRYSRRLAQRPYWRSLPLQNQSIFQNKKMLVAITFYVLTGVIVLFIIAPICQAITGENPFMWTLDFLYMSPSRMFLCLYWSLTVITTVVIWVLVLDFVPQSASSGELYSNNAEGKALTSALNKKRKLFHALAVIMFVPGVLFEKSFLQLAFGVALSGFIYLEYLRYFAVWPWGKSLHVFLTEFIDNRDLGPVILSHIYLLLGCASPVWLGSSNVLASLSGVLSLGFGDAAASIIGKRFGRYRWPGTKKTVEGTAAFIVAVFVSSAVIVYSSALVGIDGAARYVASAGRGEWLNYSAVITLTALLEAFSTQNDNIIIPLYMYALVVLSHTM